MSIKLLKGYTVIMPKSSEFINS